MNIKKFYLGLITFILLFIGILNNAKIIKTNAATNDNYEINTLSNVSGSMIATFTETGKSSINLTQNTVYEGWDYNNVGTLNISLSELNTNVIYKLIISMDNLLYLPVDVLPCPKGATAKFEKNEKIKVNGNSEYEGMPFSGTLTYTFNSESTKIVALGNFEIEFKYDEILWNNLANINLGNGTDPLLNIKLVAEEEVLDERSIIDIITGTKGFHSYNANFSIGNNIGGNSIKGRPEDTLTFALSNESSFYYPGQYYSELDIELNIPCYTLGDMKYYLQYNVDDINIFTGKNNVLDKSQYSLVASEDKIIIHLDDYYYSSTTTLLKINFTFPQDDELLSKNDIFTFKGDFVSYVDGDTNLLLNRFEEKYDISLNTNQESQLSLEYAAGSIDYRNDTVVQPIGGLGLKNDGGNSGRIKLLYNFDNDLSDENTVLVTTIRLLPDVITPYFDIKYSLMDEEGNLIYFDEEGNVVDENTPGATQYWNVSVANKYCLTPAKYPFAYNSSVLFQRKDLRDDHEIYYFKTIEYTLGEIKSGVTIWHKSAVFSYGSSTGTFWGYAKFNGANKSVISNVKVYEEDIQNNFILKFDRNISTKSYKTDSVAYGMENGSVSTKTVNAGDSFKISGQIKTFSYPYTANNIFNTEENPAVIGIKLPDGIKINKTGSKFTDSTGKVVINIMSITSKSLGDGYNFWTIELDGGCLIGYCSESLGAISTGSSIKYDIEFNTELTTSATTLYIRDIVYVSAKGIINGASGSYADGSIVDQYDLNGNGSITDKIGCFRSGNSSITVQIVEKNATLEIFDGFAINGEINEELVGTIKKNNDIIKYELEINCISGGKAEDFSYYIPIVKKDSIVDNELIFSAEYSYKLIDKVKVSNSIASNGVKILYCFDKNVTYQLLNSRSILWYEDIPADKKLEDVTVIKVIPQSTIIENGSMSIVTVLMTYDEADSEYLSTAGFKNSWTSKGQYKFMIGDRYANQQFSNEKKDLSVNYTLDEQIIELTTSIGDHTDNVGNDSEILNITQTFIKDQTYKITSVTTYNALITTVANMEANAHLYSGDEANRTFAFYSTLDSNAKKDISQSNVELGTVLGGKEFNLNFEIFNADVISDITTIRYIEVIIESDNGVTIPVRINIKRELTVIGTVSNSISTGKQYTLFGTTQTEVEISKDSAFTAQFSAENIIPNNYKGRKLVFGNPLPSGSTIVLIDLTYTNNVKYYIYVIKSTDTNQIDLTQFNIMGKKDNYSVTKGLEAITEKLLFIIDLPDDNNLPDGTINSINLVRTLNSNVDEISSSNLEFVTKDIRTFDLETNDSVELGEEIEVEYKVSEINYNDSKYNNRKLSLIIKPTSILSISNSSIEYNGTIQYLNSNNEFIIPLTDVQSAGIYTIKFKYNCPTIKNNSVTCDLNIRLMASATSSAEKPHMGQTLKETNITITTKAKPSLKIESMSDRVIEKEELKNLVTIKYDTLNVNGKVTLALQTKIGGGYTTDSTLLEAINGSTTQTSGEFTVTNVKTLNLKFSEFMPTGNYQILFTIYDNDGNIQRTVNYKFVVI